jgi:hypothetical protein
MEHCEATLSGIGGECYGGPSLKDNSIATINRNAFAYTPRPSHSKRAGRRSPAHPNN